MEVSPMSHHFSLYPRFVRLLGLLLTFFGPPVWALAITSYSFTTFDVPGATNTSASSINASGQAAGSYDGGAGSGENGIFVYSGGTFATLAIPGAVFISASSINANGQVAGYYRDQSYIAHGFVYDNGTLKVLDVPGALYTYASGINDSGQVTGAYSDGVGEQGFLYSNGAFATFAVPNADSTSVSSINASGQVAGDYYIDGSGENGIFIYSGGAFTTFAIPGADIFAKSINASGQVTGPYYDESGGSSFLYDNGTFTTFYLGNSTYARSINDSGQVAGFFYPSPGAARGFVYGNGTSTIFNVPNAAGTAPTSINASGQVTGIYWFDSSGTPGAHSFIATPLADPTPLIDHYYRSIIDRAPDPGGLAFWQSEIDHLRALGVDAKEAFRVMAGWFFTSDEYLSRDTENGQYVTDLYRTFFRRDPDSGGLSFWTKQLAQEMPRAVVLFSFLFSAEFDSYMRGLLGDTGSRAEINAVVDFYRGFLNRLPDTDGFTYWLNRFRAAQCQGAAAVSAEVNSISAQFLGSAEYTGRNRSNPGYVADLYYAFLRRGGDLAGFDFWVGQLDDGEETREQLRQEFLASPEFQSRVQQIISQGCLK